MKKTIKRLLLDLIVLVFAMLTIIFFWKNTLLTTVFLVILSIALLIKTSKTDILFFAIISISATFIETITISSGAWIYSTQHLFIVPLWIPLYWGIGGTVMKDIYFVLKEK